MRQKRLLWGLLPHCCSDLDCTLFVFCSLQRRHPVLTRTATTTMTTSMTTLVSIGLACTHVLCFIVLHVRRVASCFSHNLDPLSYSNHTSLSFLKPHQWGLTSCLFPPKPSRRTVNRVSQDLKIDSIWFKESTDCDSIDYTIVVFFSINSTSFSWSSVSDQLTKLFPKGGWLVILTSKNTLDRSFPTYVGKTSDM